MPHMVLKDARVEVNSVNLSAHVRSVTIDYAAEEVDDSVMGTAGKKRVAGLVDAKVNVTWAQDYAAAQVDATLFPLVGAAAFNIKVRPTTSAVSATNPEFQGSAILTSYQPISGDVGALNMAETEFPVDGLLTRAVA